MTLALDRVTDNSFPLLTDSQRDVLTTRAIDPDRAVADGLVVPHGCDLRFPTLGGGNGGVVRSCRDCQAHGRAKYLSPPGHTPQPTVVHDAGSGSPVLYVEGVLKALSAQQAAQDGSLPYTIVFINGADGVNRNTSDVVSGQVAGRDVLVIFDADIDTNPHVALSAKRVESRLREAGADTVRFPRVPTVGDDPHTGLDDYLASVAPKSRPEAFSALVAAAPPDLLDRSSLEALVASLGPSERLDHARRIAATVCSMGLPEVDVLDWRSLLKSVCGLSQGDFDAIRKDAQTQKRVSERARAEEKITQKGLQMPSPSEPTEVAHKLVELHPFLQDRVRVWRGDIYTWCDTHWSVMPDTELTDFLRRELRHAWFMGGGKNPGPASWSPTKSKIDEVATALATILRRRDREEPDTGLFTYSGQVAMDGSVTEPHPSVFNLTCVPYAYDPEAQHPNWSAYLNTSLPSEEDQQLVQEMLGYLLSGETNQQKIFFLSGPPGSGKGTLIRVIQALFGPEAFTSTSLPALGSHFGRASLLGKSVAFLPDARFNVKDASSAVEPLLSISGEDAIVVPRKNKDDWIGKLPTRLVMASNDLPVLHDNSAALHRRLVVVQFGQSFAGREDYGLTGRLLSELPGILNWGLAGYARLTERGKFLSTQGGEEIAAAARRESSPVFAFLEDMCVLEPGARVPSSDLFAAWEEFRREQNFSRMDLSKPGLTRAVIGTVPGIETRVAKVGGKPQRCLIGIRLKDAAPSLEAPAPGPAVNPFSSPGTR